MSNEVPAKFRKGDRVVVNNPETWCDGCHGVVKGVFHMNPPCYLVRLDESPSSSIRESFVYENYLKFEEVTA